MFFGTGKLEIRLMKPDGTGQETIVPVRPSERVFQDFEDVMTTLPADSFGYVDEEFEGVKFRGVYRWISHLHNQSDMAKIMKIGNWRGGDRFVNLWPHEEQPQIQLRCEVRRCGVVPVDGKIHGDVIELELIGMDILERKPNPLYDKVSRVYGRGSIVTGRVFGS